MEWSAFNVRIAENVIRDELIQVMMDEEISSDVFRKADLRASFDINAAEVKRMILNRRERFV